MLHIDCRATVFANGNNITPASDMVRRTIMCSLDTNMERPELREFRDSPLDRILADRGKYIAACLTIVRAHLAAGEPVKPSPLASFEEWSRMVRAPLIWLGEPDPVKTMESIREEDPELLVFSAVMAELKKLLDENGGQMTAGEIKDAADVRLSSNDDSNHYGSARYRHPELRQILLDVARLRGEIDTGRLGGFLKRFKGRIVGGMKLTAEYDRKRKQLKWEITQAKEATT